VEAADDIDDALRVLTRAAEQNESLPQALEQNGQKGKGFKESLNRYRGGCMTLLTSSQQL
jgi:hypothetical protein